MSAILVRCEDGAMLAEKKGTSCSALAMSAISGFNVLPEWGGRCRSWCGGLEGS